ncbi:hypothetical protein [uncultured Clostridium sp.]|uniref:hypothetical protein n=1 Tax=uncultured Clostridium sp. TaxID=59620 RepID=UPI00259008A1|nr:hypothetical protein [uncultured Clostridium sp.]
MSTIDINFNELLNNRLDHLGADVVINNPGYIEAKSNTDKLYNQLKDVLTEEQYKLFNEYNEAVNWKDAIAEDLSYKLGIKDGYKIRETLDTNLLGA